MLDTLLAWLGAIGDTYMCLGRSPAHASTRRRLVYFSNGGVPPSLALYRPCACLALPCSSSLLTLPKLSTVACMADGPWPMVFISLHSTRPLTLQVGQDGMERQTDSHSSQQSVSRGTRRRKRSYLFLLPLHGHNMPHVPLYLGSVE